MVNINSKGPDWTYIVQFLLLWRVKWNRGKCLKSDRLTPLDSQHPPKSFGWAPHSSIFNETDLFWYFPCSLSCKILTTDASMWWSYKLTWWATVASHLLGGTCFLWLQLGICLHTAGEREKEKWECPSVLISNCEYNPRAASANAGPELWDGNLTPIPQKESQAGTEIFLMAKCSQRGQTAFFKG